MRRRMTTTLAALAVAAGSLTLAAPTITVDDSGIDYRNGTYARTERDTGYAQLTKDGDDIVLVLSQSRLDGSLPAIDLVVWDAGYDRRGELRQGGLANVEGVELEGLGAYYSAFSVTHPDATVKAAVDAWTAALERLGYRAASVEQERTSAVATFDGPEGGLRVTFQATGDGVRVHLAAA